MSAGLLSFPRSPPSFEASELIDATIFVKLSKKMVPAVVNISTLSTIKGRLTASLRPRIFSANFSATSSAAIPTEADRAVAVVTTKRTTPPLRFLRARRPRTFPRRCRSGPVSSSTRPA